jgi:uncharacterized coiled-coil DUF342 family protein
MAVDNLVDGLANAGVKPLRVGGSIQKSLIEHSLEYKLEKHPLHPKLVMSVAEEEKLARQIPELEKARKALNKKLWETMNQSTSMRERENNMGKAVIAMKTQRKNLQQKIYAIQQEMLREIVKAADVVSAQI